MRGRVGSSLVAAVAAAACSSSISTSNSPFGGLWTCEDQLTYVFSLPPGAGTQTETISSSLGFVDQASGTITASSSSDAGSCSLTFTTSGGTAVLQSAQPCTESGVTLDYTSATYTVSGNTMTGSLQGTFSGTVSGTQTAGTLSASSTCTRS
jgi:hypothetical protein